MTLPFEFHPEARVEFFAEIDWYDAREVGLGDRFEAGVLLAVDDSVDSPDAWPPWPGWNPPPVVRSKQVQGFPFRVVYFVEHDLLKVVAVAHSKRRPGYWRDRVSV
ncbi:MAG: type II toxin-antitoxin system RelE/ParE family toxin [Nocardioides sp.]|uniref:type II toxin-antitoxin system RelE/ParE family toxin n=1 Tax=Nocardioides sp. TaxID=35761 RepID=UPI0039E62FA6